MIFFSWYSPFELVGRQMKHDDKTFGGIDVIRLSISILLIK